MKKLTKPLQLLLLLVFSITLISYFQSCDDISTNPKSDMVIKNIEGPTNLDCGGYKWAVQFILKFASPKGGYFVQEVRIRRTISKECPNEYKDFDITYYEAWKVNEGKTITATAEAGFTDDDTYMMPSMYQSEGSSDFTGIVKFFENITLPDDFQIRNPQTFAGILPSTRKKPDFWDATDALDHDLDSDWDCCDTSTHILLTTPDFSKVSKGEKTPLGGKFFEQVESVKAWTDESGYSENDNYTLLESASQVASLTDDEIITGVADYSEYYAGYIPEMSKLYLILRYVYDVPNNLPMENAYSYGGWIHPNEVISNSAYDLMWPLGWNEMNMIVVDHEFMGYIGAGYDAIGELSYFMENFDKREL